MGSGKTTISKLLHEKVNNVAHIGLDRIKWFVSGFKRTKVQNKKARAIVMAMAKEYLKQGISVIVDDAMKQEQITAYKKIAKAAKATFLTYKLNASKEVLLIRVSARTLIPGRPKVSLTRVQRNYKLYNNFNKHKNAVVFNTEKLSPKQILNLILKDIK